MPFARKHAPDVLVALGAGCLVAGVFLFLGPGPAVAALGVALIAIAVLLGRVL
jgi:multisubunit Na+/H+ antiporter MnhG subunit